MENKVETNEHQGTKNLIPVTERTKEEAKKISKKGGEASGEARRRKKKIKEVISALFATKAPEKQKEKLKEIFPDSDIETIEDLLNLAMVKNAIKGNVQAYNSLYDRLEGRPRQNIGLDGGEDGKPIVSEVNVSFKDYEDDKPVSE